MNDDGYKYEDVSPANATTYTIKGLEVDTQYVFSIMALNKLGNSKYMPDLLSAKTSSESMFNCSNFSNNVITKTNFIPC